MTTPQNWLDQGVQTVAIAGTDLPQRTRLNVVSGATGADNPTTLSTDITIAAGGGFITYSQDCTVGGTILSTAPANANQINFTGTPSAGFTFKLAAGACALTIYNKTGQVATITNVTTPGAAVILQAYSSVLVFSPGGTADVIQVAATLPGGSAGDVIPYSSTSSTYYIVESLAHVNYQAAGEQQSIPIYGAVLNQRDATSYSVTPPSVGGGSTGTGAAIWETTYASGDPTLLYGTKIQSQSGATDAVSREVYGTQESQYVLRGGQAFIYRTTGKSIAVTTALPVLVEHTTRFRVTINGRVVTVGSGGSEAVGDSFVIDTMVVAGNPSGTAVIVPLVTGPTPFVAYTASMADVAISFTVSTGYLNITSTSGALIGTGCIIDWQIDVEGLVN